MPAEDALDSGLELEDDTDASIEAAEVVGHGGDVEVGPLGLRRRMVVGSKGNVVGIIFVRWDDLLKEPGGHS
jgi:hypothetical protein